MVSSSELCNCKENRRLDSPVLLYCGRCEGRIQPREQTAALDEHNLRTTGGQPEENSDGNFRIVTGASHKQFDPDRRGILIALGVSTLASALVTTCSMFLSLHPAVLELEEVAHMKWRAGRLTEDDIQIIENSIGDVRELSGLKEDYARNDRRAVVQLIDALMGHIGGTSPEYSVTILTRLLAEDYSPDVERFLLLHRSKVSAHVGEAEKGLDDLEEAIALTPEKGKSRVKLLRQAMNHAYISIPRQDVLDPTRWSRLRGYLDEALEIVGLSPDAPSNWVARTDQAAKFDPYLGPGILVFEALIRAAEFRNSPDQCKLGLNWHLELIDQMGRYDPVTAWNRYTPLAAQALALGHLDFAQEALHRARDYALGQRTGPIANYAALQRNIRGAEWLFHQVLFAALHIARSKIESPGQDRERQLELAANALEEPLAPNNRNQAMLLLRAAKFYEASTLTDEKQIQDARVGAYNTAAYTHWTYLP